VNCAGSTVSSSVVNLDDRTVCARPDTIDSDSPHITVGEQGSSCGGDPTPTPTVTPTPTPTQMIGQCYTINVSDTVNQDNYGIKYTDPNVGAEQSVKFNMLVPIDGGSYKIFYICSNNDPTLLDYTGGSPTGIGSISGVIKLGPNGICDSSFDCASSVTETPTPTPIPTATPTTPPSVPTVDTCGATATFAIANNTIGVNVGYTVPTDGNSSFLTCTLTGSPLSPGTSDSFVGGFGPSYTTEISGASGKQLRTWVGSTLFSTITLTGTSTFVNGDASYGSSFVILEIID
jgi:hypothetical protein